MRTKIIAGKKVTKRAKVAPLQALVGKTIAAIGIAAVPSAYGPEPCTVLYFTDGTRHGFVHPSS